MALSWHTTSLFIVAGESKEVGFKKDHVIQVNDIPELIKTGNMEGVTIYYEKNPHCR